MSLPGSSRFLIRRCFTLCITMEVESRIGKQYKCHHCCSCKNYCGKGDGGWKKVFLHHFLADQNIVSLWREKKHFGASYCMNNELLLVPNTF